MSSSTRILVAFSLGIGGLLLAQMLRAEGAVIAVRYTAPIECPSEREFLLDAHGRNARIADRPTSEEPQFLVTIWKGASPPYAGRLERARASGSVGVREIGGNTCAEVSSALALITALTGDLAAPTPTEPSSPRADTTGESIVLPVPPGRSLAETSRPSSSDATRSGSVSWLRWQLGGAATLSFGMTPHPLVAGTVFVQTSARTSAFWAPSVRLSGLIGHSSWSPDGVSGGADGQFLWVAGGLDGCPFRIGDPLDLSLTSCARVTIGALDVSSSGRPTGPHRETRLWVDVGGLLRGRWQLARALFVDFEGGLFVPLPRYALNFDDPPRAYVEPAIGYRLGASAGLVVW